LPTLKPRLQVTLTPATYATIKRVAALQSRSRGAVISEWMDECAPVLGRVADLLQAAQATDKAGRSHLVRQLAKVQTSIEGAAADAISAFAAVTGKAPPGVPTRGGGGASPRRRRRREDA